MSFRLNPRIPFLLALGGCIAALIVTCSGCASGKDARRDGPPPDLTAIASTCEQGPDLTIPTAINSQQLEELLYAAYIEARARLAACATQETVHGNP